jgi:hypothetical protein
MTKTFRFWQRLVIRRFNEKIGHLLTESLNQLGFCDARCWRPSFLSPEAAEGRGTGKHKKSKQKNKLASADKRERKI